MNHKNTPPARNLNREICRRLMPDGRILVIFRDGTRQIAGRQ